MATVVDRLFVYGTLRLGSNHEHALALAAQARHLCAARVPGRLYRVAHYPGLVVPQNENDWVVGDVFENVTDALFQRLDGYEGSDYRRELTEVTLASGRTIAAYLYRYLLPTGSLALIPSGDFMHPDA